MHSNSAVTQKLSKMLRHNQKGMSKIGNIKQTDMYIINMLKIIFILHTVETYNTDCTKDYRKLFII